MLEAGRIGGAGGEKFLPDATGKLGREEVVVDGKVEGPYAGAGKKPGGGAYAEAEGG